MIASKIPQQFFVDDKKSISVIDKTKDSISIQKVDISLDLYNYICSIYKNFEKVNIILSDELTLIVNRFVNDDIPF